jgi:ABC-2 type transport system ATP-binding protein
LDAIKKISGVKKVSFKEGAIEVLASNGQEVLQDVLFSLAKNNVRVKSFSLAEPDLESLFLSITGRNLRD